MENTQREFLDELLGTDSPSGFETAAQRVWVEYVSTFADEVTVDEYGNAVAVLDGGEPEIAFTGHADEIGFTIRRVTDEGFLRISRIGGSDRTVSRGQHVTVHTAEGPVAGVIGQTAIHLRDTQEEELIDIDEQYVDIGVESREAALDVVGIGDPITIAQRVRELAGSRLAARGLDNRVGIWAAAEGLRKASQRGTAGTVYAVSTVQEEVGLQGAKMVGFDLDPDAVVAVDVTHATDNPDVPEEKQTAVTLGGGPVVSRGSSNHPTLVTAMREVGADADIGLQYRAAGIATGTDADAFFTARGGIPSLYLGIPNRYMHTPVEVVDTTDLDALTELLGAFAAQAPSHSPFSVSL